VTPFVGAPPPRTPMQTAGPTGRDPPAGRPAERRGGLSVQPPLPPEVAGFRLAVSPDGRSLFSPDCTACSNYRRLHPCRPMSLRSGLIGGCDMSEHFLGGALASLALIHDCRRLAASARGPHGTHLKFCRTARLRPSKAVTCGLALGPAPAMMSACPLLRRSPAATRTPPRKPAQKRSNSEESFAAEDVDLRNYSSKVHDRCG
jgi:hypothetical protein